MAKTPGARVDEGLEGLTLETINDGALEQQFQERVFQALEALRDFRRLKPSAEGVVVEIPMVVKVIYNPADSTYLLDTRVDHIKLPKPYTARGKAYRRDGGLMVKPEPQQQTLAPVPLRQPTGSDAGGN